MLFFFIMLCELYSLTLLCVCAHACLRGHRVGGRAFFDLHGEKTRMFARSFAC